MTDNRDAHTEETNRVRETYAAMRARIPQRDLGSAREEFDRWMARIKADAAAEIVAAVEALATKWETPGSDAFGPMWAKALRAALSAGRTALDTRLAQARAEALREAADEIEEDMAIAWGGNAGWLTSGHHVASLVAGFLRDRAEASGEGQ